MGWFDREKKPQRRVKVQPGQPGQPDQPPQQSQQSQSQQSQQSPGLDPSGQPWTDFDRVLAALIHIDLEIPPSPPGGLGDCPRIVVIPDELVDDLIREALRDAVDEQEAANANANQPTPTPAPAANDDDWFTQRDWDWDQQEPK